MEPPQSEIDRHPEWQHAFRQVESRPEDPRAHFQLGMVALELGAFSKAVRSFRRVSELAPRVEAGHFNLGNALFETGDFREAIEAYEAALRLSPKLVLGTISAIVIHSLAFSRMRFEITNRLYDRLPIFSRREAAITI